jgi:hypothetical protein
MAAISVTAANVLRVDGEVVTFPAGVAITAGQYVYVDGNGAVQVATNATSAGSGVGAQHVGVALNGGGVGQPIQILKPGGTVNIGGTVAVGKPYVLGTAGGIIPVDDIAGTEFITGVGIGLTTANIKLASNNVSGVQAAGAVS